MSSHTKRKPSTVPKPRCIYCNRKLPRASEGAEKREGRPVFGAYADGFFCGIGCARLFGLVLARGGRRIMRDGVELTGAPDCPAREVKP